MDEICRCCMANGCYYKDITNEYVWLGKKEVYLEMLNETFDLHISQIELTDKEVKICEPCVGRLRDATEFKRQVQESHAILTQKSDTDITIEFLEDSHVKEEALVKVEMSDETDEAAVGVSSDDEVSTSGDNVLFKRSSKRSAEISSLYKFLTTPDDDPVGGGDATPAKRTRASRLTRLPDIKLTKNRLVIKTTKSSAARQLAPTVGGAGKLRLGSKILKKAPTEEEHEDESSRNTEMALGAEALARQNARVLVRHTTAFPFRLPARSVVCAYCGAASPAPAAFRRHMRAHHAAFRVASAFTRLGNAYLKVDITELQCRVCGAALASLAAALRHLAERHGERRASPEHAAGLLPFRFADDARFSCALCPRSFPGLPELSRHTGSHFERYPCEACGKCYSTTAALNTHVTYSHSSDGLLLCRKCKQRFPDAAAKSRHLAESAQCWQYTCWRCKQRFRSYRHKRRHLEEAHGERGAAHACTECGLQFPSGAKRNKHFRLTHTEAAFVCSCCGLKFDSKNEFESHRFVHTKELLVTCKFCSKSFSREKSLKQHLWIHMEKKRFQCAPCNKQFNQRVSWRTHMKSYHPDVDTEKS